jgi:phage tail sheath protein FI
MEALCSSEGFAWNCFVDSGPPSAIVNVAQADAESALYTSAQGHLAFYSNYMVDLEGRLVPPSAAVAGIYLARASAEGFQQPAAGGKYPIKGISGLQWQLTKAQQAVSNPLGNNLLRYLPNQGNLVYGSRTRSNSPYYKFVNTRVILNVLIGTLRGAFDELVFSAVDGRGVLFSRIRETAEAICYRLYQGGALFGATPDEAFFCQCNDANNPDLDLEDGVVRLDCYVAPVPTMERLLINVVRTAIGQVQIVAQQVNN